MQVAIHLDLIFNLSLSGTVIILVLVRKTTKVMICGSIDTLPVVDRKRRYVRQLRYWDTTP